MLDLQEKLTAFAMLGATWVMWLLVILSIFGVAVILERSYYFLRSRGDARELQETLRLMLARGQLEEIKQLCARLDSFEGRILHAGLEGAKDGVESVIERMEGEKILARAQMERYLAFLGTLGNNAPFIGLLGTVIGIIRAFHALHESAGQVSTGLMSDVGEALVATAIGLLVALPAVAAYNFFQRMIRNRITWAEALESDLLAYLKRS